jgi:RES domain-containing protein
MASRPKGPRGKPLTAYRIADSRHPIFDGNGASLIGGRWNSPGHAVIYAAASYAGAMLERLVHAGTGRIPKNQKATVITIPARVSNEEWTAEQLSQGWDSENNIVSRAFGDTWLNQERSAVLVVPSAIAKYEKNVLINPAHPDFKWIVASSPQEVIWDARLFTKHRT